MKKSYEDLVRADLKRLGWDVVIETTRDGDTFARAVNKQGTVIKKINIDRFDAVSRLYAAALAAS